MNGGPPGFVLDSGRVRRNFDRASATYDGSAVLQAEVRELLLARLQLTSLAPRVALDAGAGTGHACRELKRRYPAAQVIALDSSVGMLRTAAKQRSWIRPFARVCADATRLPFADGSMDLIISNCMLQWSDLDLAFAEFRRVLAPRGLLSFATLGPDTLRELRSAWARIDDHAHVTHFLDMHDIGDALVRAGFSSPVLDVERYTLWYDQVTGLFNDLRATGAGNAALDRQKGLTTPRRLAAMRAAYECCRYAGRLPATCEIVFGQAWVPLATSRRPASGDIQVSLEEFSRQVRERRDG